MLSWTGSVSPNVINYNVYRSGSSGGPYNFIASVGTATNYDDYNVQNGQSYYYVARALDNTGQESVYSNQAVAAVPIAISHTATVSLVVGVGDFNGDGIPDLLWQNDSTRQVAVWYMGGSGGAVLQSSAYINSAVVSGWSVVN